MSFYEDRNKWLKASDEEFFKECSHDWFQASGPGGQKRNRKYSGVRIHHKPTGLTAEEVQSRSQNDNKHNAIRKLKIKLAVETEGPEIDLIRHDVSSGNSEYPLFAAKIFDTLKQYNYSMSEAADDLKMTTSHLIKILAKDEYLWREVNQTREKLGLHRLKI